MNGYIYIVFESDIYVRMTKQIYEMMVNLSRDDDRVFI